MYFLITVIIPIYLNLFKINLRNSNSTTNLHHNLQVISIQN